MIMSGSEIASNVRSHWRFATETRTRVSSVSLSSACLGVVVMVPGACRRDGRLGSQDRQDAIDRAQAGVNAQDVLGVLDVDGQPVADVLATGRGQRLVRAGGAHAGAVLEGGGDDERRDL